MCIGFLALGPQDLQIVRLLSEHAPVQGLRTTLPDRARVEYDRRAYGGPFSVRCGRKVRPHPFNNDLQFRSFSARHSFTEVFVFQRKTLPFAERHLFNERCLAAERAAFGEPVCHYHPGAAPVSPSPSSWSLKQAEFALLVLLF